MATTETDPCFFSISDDEEAGYAVHPDAGDTSQDEMDQDSGKSKLDEKRKSRAYAPSTSDWKEAPAPFVTDGGYPSFGPQGGEESSGGQDSQRVFVPIKVKKEDVNVIPVKNLAGARPVNLPQLRVRELQCDCDRWGIQTSGTRAEIVERLEQLYAGKAVGKKGCAKKFVQLKAVGATASTTSAPRPAAAASSSGSSIMARAPDTFLAASPAKVASSRRK